MAEEARANGRLARSRQGSSDRSFGLVIAVALGVIALLPWLAGRPPLWWLGATGAAFALTAWLRPASLAPLNRAWTRLGLALHRVVSPAVLAIIFFLAVTPVGLLMRWFGHDPLNRRFRSAGKSLWHRPGEAASRSMMKQF
jgi:hypothetical protein